MGKTSTPLMFLFTDRFANEHPTEIQELVDKGHRVMYTGIEFDIILDPKAWRTWTDPTTGRIANLDMAIKAARVAKKLREKK